jgi:hypothetical protein
MDSLQHKLTTFIRSTTRSCQFNFDEVARLINESPEWRVALHRSLTPEECRRIFAEDYLGSENMRNPTELEHQIVDNLDKNSTSKSEQDDLTLLDVLRNQEINRSINEKKIESIFQRVLSALETSEKIALDKDDEILVARKAQLEIRENERLRQQLLEDEAREQQLLDEQRTLLRKRFDADSEDAQGIDPLALRKVSDGRR